MQVTLARDGTLGPPASKPEIVLYKAPRAKILWPVEVLGHEGDFVRILSFDRKKEEKLVPATSLSPLADIPANAKSADLKKAYKLALARLDA